MKFTKISSLLLLIVITIFSLTACSKKNDISDRIFPSVDNADIPDILEITVGTVGDTTFSSGIKDNPDYKSLLIVTFKDTTEADYTMLMEHYQSDATGTDENGMLLFDWGKLQVTSDDALITINAYIK